MKSDTFTSSKAGMYIVWTVRSSKIRSEYDQKISQSLVLVESSIQFGTISCIQSISKGLLAMKILHKCLLHSFKLIGSITFKLMCFIGCR